MILKIIKIQAANQRKTNKDFKTLTKNQNNKTNRLKRTTASSTPFRVQRWTSPTNRTASPQIEY